VAPGEGVPTGEYGTFWLMCMDLMSQADTAYIMSLRFLEGGFSYHAGDDPDPRMTATGAGRLSNLSLLCSSNFPMMLSLS